MKQRTTCPDIHMHLPQLLSMAALTMALTSCGMVRSSLQYTEGTQALQRGDYPTAVSKLEEAVRLDPSTSKNHANLAAAYLKSGRGKEAWKHSRIAVGLNPNDAGGRASFAMFWNDFEKRGILSPGSSQANVRSAMGEPDFIKPASPADLWIYGRKGVYFHNGLLKEVRDL